MVEGAAVGDARLVVGLRIGPERAGDRGGFGHHAAGGVHGGGFHIDRLGRGAGQHRHGAAGEVGQQLVPDLVTDAGRRLAADPACREQFRQRADPRGHVPVGLAQDDAAVLLLHLDDAGRDHGARRVHHAADRASRAERAAQGVVGVDAGQGAAAERRGQAIAVPPRDAVHDEGDGGVGAEERGQPGGDEGQGRGLHRDQHRVLLPQPGGIVGGGGAGVVRAVGRVDGQPVRLDRRQMRPARHHGDGRAGAGEPHREVPADRPGAVDADPHAGFLPASRQRITDRTREQSDGPAPARVGRSGAAASGGSAVRHRDRRRRPALSRSAPQPLAASGRGRGRWRRSPPRCRAAAGCLSPAVRRGCAIPARRGSAPPRPVRPGGTPSRTPHTPAPRPRTARRRSCRGRGRSTASRSRSGCACRRGSARTCRRP